MTYRCIKPQCPPDCAMCNCAIPESDDAAMLVFDLLTSLAIGGFEEPLEDGENATVDRARKWLITRANTPAKTPPLCEGCGKTIAEHSPLLQCFASVERESVADALLIVDSYGPWGADLNDAHRRQIVLADEVKRLSGLYQMAVAGRAEMRHALRRCGQPY